MQRQITKEMLLSERDDFGNTLLQQAILRGQTAEALRLLEIDKQEKPDGSIINAFRIGGNSALLLALKTGQLDVARTILNHPGVVDINLADDFGMKAIHWASFFRADDIIQKLLEMNAETELKKPDSSNRVFKQFAHLTPADFYQTELAPLNLLEVPEAISDPNPEIIELKTSEAGAKVLMTVSLNSVFEEPGVFNRTDLPKYQKLFPNVKNALVHVPLKTMAFYFDVLGPKYAGSDKENFTSAFDLPLVEDPRLFKKDTLIFRENFINGYPAFRGVRNQKPVNQEILTHLKDAHNAQSKVSKIIKTESEDKKAARVTVPKIPEQSAAISETMIFSGSANKLTINQVKAGLIQLLSDEISKALKNKNGALASTLNEAMTKLNKVTKLDEIGAIIKALQADLPTLVPQTKKKGFGSLFGSSSNSDAVSDSQIHSLSEALKEFAKTYVEPSSAFRIERL